jgi:hypothetical protein
MRRSMLAMIESGDAKEAHPAYWAPFVVVGEGSWANAHADAGPVTVLPTPTKKVAPKPRPKTQVPWTAEIWRKQVN